PAELPAEYEVVSYAPGLEPPAPDPTPPEPLDLDPEPEPLPDRPLRRRPPRRRRPASDLTNVLVVWGAIGFGIGVAGGLWMSQYMPLFGDWLSIHFAQPWSPARMNYIPIHVLVCGVLGAVGLAAFGWVSNRQYYAPWRDDRDERER